MAFHGVRAALGVARDDGRDDRLVAGLRDRAREARARDDAQHLGDLDLDLRLGGDQPARARGLGDRDVEARVGEPEGRELADGALGRRCGLDDRRALGRRSARSAASAAASPEIARRQSVSSRSALRVGGSPPSTSAAGGSSRTNEPPVRPRRVSTNPASRRICSAWRSVIGATPSCAASSSSLGRRSPGREHARADRLAEPAHDLLDRALGLERRERDVAGG